MNEIVNSETAISLLEELVAIPSVSLNEHEAAVYLMDWLNSHGFGASLDEVGNAVGTRGEGSREILLLGHIDTFPGELPVYRDGEWLYGRGTIDAKGPLCAFAVAAATIDIPSDWRVKVVAAVEEEVPGSRGARYIASQASQPDYCVIGEPSGWDRVTLGYKGVLLARIRMRLALSHSAGQGKLPAEAAVECWNAMVAYSEEVNAGRVREFDRLSPYLRQIATSDEGAYSTAEFQAGFRLPLDIKSYDLEPVIQNILSLAGVEESEWEVINREEAYRCEKNTPLVRNILAAIREQEGLPRFVYKTGTTDMNVVGPVWNVPIVAYGPGDSALDHTPGERINLGEYRQSIEVLRTLLTRMIQA